MLDATTRVTKPLQAGKCPMPIKRRMEMIANKGDRLPLVLPIGEGGITALRCVKPNLMKL
jgi:hypothetical protein